MSAALRSTHHRVLVADDEPITLQVIKRQLTMLGFARIAVATTATEALRTLRDGDFGLVVSDYMLPPINGLDLRRVMRSNPSWAAIPFVIVTSVSTKARIWPACLDIVDDVLAKPFGAAQLALCLARALGDVPKVPVPAPDIFEV